jgi:hypothetical protein
MIVAPDAGASTMIQESLSEILVPLSRNLRPSMRTFGAVILMTVPRPALVSVASPADRKTIELRISKFPV